LEVMSTMPGLTLAAIALAFSEPVPVLALPELPLLAPPFRPAAAAEGRERIGN